jgi:hypothetical protein
MSDYISNGESGASVREKLNISHAGVTLHKPERGAPCLIKTGAQTISIAAETKVAAPAVAVSYTSDTAVSMPALTTGEDYSVWVHPDGSASAVADPYSAPATAPVTGAVKIGGFHHGAVPPGTTVAGGSFATTGDGMIWTQSDVDLIAGINAHSIWDQKFRPTCDPRGMALVARAFWADLYLTGATHDADGTSRHGSSVASGTVLPRIPAAFGGNGAATYATLNWWQAVEIAGAHGKRLFTEAEFVRAAYGVTEARSLGGAAETVPATLRQPGYTSKWGLEQASGHQYIWGLDAHYRANGTSEGWAWRASTGGRGSLLLYNNVALTRVLLGGARGDGSTSGSRASNWSLSPWYSYWTTGLRALGDHLELD